MAEYDTRILVPVTSEMRAAIDDVCGSRGRSEFIRSAVRVALEGASDVPALPVGLEGHGRVPADAPAARKEPFGRLTVTGFQAGGLPPLPSRRVDARFGVIEASMRKRGGRSDVRRISEDTGLPEMLVDRLLRQMRVCWPEPGVVELVE